MTMIFDKNFLTAGLNIAIKQESILKVHAEVKIQLYFVQQGLARRMINNNIGVSKLCCPECYALLGAAKEDLKILVHGQHQKWYPWPFSFSLSQDFSTTEQLFKTRNEILTNFLKDYEALHLARISTLWVSLTFRLLRKRNRICQKRKLKRSFLHSKKNLM